MTNQEKFGIWNLFQWIGLVLTILLLLCLILFPKLGLFMLWQVLIPVLPFVFFVMPGLWRNVCPLAMLNQLPKKFGLSRGKSTPKWFKSNATVIAVGTLFLLVSMRKIFFNYEGVGLAFIIVLVAVIAISMGYFFQGKSGWCTSICPVYPVELLYGHTPFYQIENAHCSTCQNCTAHCYDQYPKWSYFSDIHLAKGRFQKDRIIFSGLFPGFVLAYFILPDPQTVTDILVMYLWFAISMGISLLVMSLVRKTNLIDVGLLSSVFGVLALNLYYWFSLPLYIENAVATNRENVFWFLYLILFSLSIWWLMRVSRKSKQLREALINKPNLSLPVLNNL